MSLVILTSQFQTNSWSSKIQSVEFSGAIHTNLQSILGLIFFGVFGLLPAKKDLHIWVASSQSQPNKSILQLGNNATTEIGYYVFRFSCSIIL